MSSAAGVQRARFAALDPLLPPPPPLPPGEPVEAGGAAGTIAHVRFAAGSWQRLWSPAHLQILSAFLPHDAGAGMSALLSAWRERIALADAEPDSSCTVTWPSRDVVVARALLDHGLAPQLALAVRAPAAGEAYSVPGVTVRESSGGDLEEIVALRFEELRYTSFVGHGVVRPGAEALLEEEVRRGLQFGGRVWIAEEEGVTVGMVTSGKRSPLPGDALAGRLPPGEWGYVGTLAVTAAARGRGIGRALTAAAHDELFSPSLRGTFVSYNPANPLSPVFWHRQGYRPLWTTWAASPAAALR
ncbi:GNAT family N-acetyltransferase [Amycolatopsis thailandensis]|uniref:GNAT family N-acetyltransferase n=1 Tax=Amycolatopsis thailandensis TaxID=589330 RepID=A0A229SE05_9PSEU|nr:GNAT family N-acetyltransferase [Amycolatopsis thailandensis]OXM57138.1 GNAT family N-acetyltransferase [Amycolatopsis thailandensis]